MLKPILSGQPGIGVLSYCKVLRPVSTKLIAMSVPTMSHQVPQCTSHWAPAQDLGSSSLTIDNAPVSDTICELASKPLLFIRTLTTSGSGSTVAVMSPTLTGRPLSLILSSDICAASSNHRQAPAQSCLSCARVTSHPARMCLMLCMRTYHTVVLKDKEARHAQGIRSHLKACLQGVRPEGECKGHVLRGISQR